MEDSKKPLSDEEFKIRFDIVIKMLQFFNEEVILSGLYSLPLKIVEGQNIGQLSGDAKEALMRKIMLEVAGLSHEASNKFLDLCDEILQTPKDVNNPVREIMTKILDEVFDVMNLLQKASEGKELSEDEKKKYHLIVWGGEKK